MKNFLKRPIKERKQYFSVAADQIDLPVHLVEKDFWVCWLLDILFKSKLSEHLTFKGGTSLSKVYGLIRRFSEDIDLSIEKSFFGFEGERNPEEASRKRQRILLNELSEKCRGYVQNSLCVELGSIIKEELSEEEEWSLVLDGKDPAGQSLLFFYPHIAEKGADQYVSPVVKMEFGARADHWPVSMHTIKPYTQEAIPESMDGRVSVRVLNVERTFWEKATILHMYAHYPAGKEIQGRQSRHYYDMYCLINSEFCQVARGKIDLLKRVADHKTIYFRSSWASYEKARPGTLKLIPKDELLSKMADDYRAMEIMFFENAPSWKEILSALKKFEEVFNAQQAGPVTLK